MPKIDIYIKGRRKPAQSSHVQRGPIGQRREPEYLPRRPTGGMEFYDTAQIIDPMSSWGYRELAYRFGITVTTNISNGVTTSTHPGLGDYKDMTDEIFSVPLNDWETTYRKLDLATLHLKPYRMVIEPGIADSANLSDPHFTEQGLKLSASELANPDFSVHNGYFGFENTTASFFNIVTKLVGTGKKKITAIRDFTSSAVSYTPKSKDKMFLMPVLCQNQSSYAANAPGAKFDRWYDDFWPESRVLFGQDASNMPDRASWNAGTPPITSGDGYSGVFRLLGLYRSIQNDPIAHRGSAIPGGGWTYSVISPAAVPDATYWPSGGPNSFTFGLSSVVVMANPPSGALVMVIKQGTDYFYVWS